MLFRMPVKNGRRAMPCHFIIHAFCLLALAFGSALAHAGENPLTLSEALSRAMAQNPGLQVFDFRLQGLEGRRLTADQNPARPMDRGDQRPQAIRSMGAYAYGHSRRF